MLNHEWRKASASNPAGNCLQARWTRASFCSADGCLEVRQRDNGTVEVRDSKLGDDSPILRFSREEWDAHLAGVRSREFDVPVA